MSELYDLSVDPGMFRNVVGLTGNLETVRRLNGTVKELYVGFLKESPWGGRTRIESRRIGEAAVARIHKVERRLFGAEGDVGRRASGFGIVPVILTPLRPRRA